MSGSASSTEPAVLFLDEPTTGLDPQARARMWDEIRLLREARHDGLPDDPLPRGGRRARRPAGDHRPRARSWPRARPTSSSGRSPATSSPSVVNGADRARPRDGPAQPFVREATERGRPRPALRRSRRGPPCRSSSACSTVPGSRRPRSPSTAPASTTSSSSRPAARSATRRPPDPDINERNPST